MSDNYMPTTEEVLDAWVDLTTASDSRAHLVESAVEASRRWLAAVEREAAARALSDAADALNRPAEGAGYEVWASGVGDWLRARAAEIREKGQGE